MPLQVFRPLLCLSSSRLDRSNLNKRVERGAFAAMTLSLSLTLTSKKRGRRQGILKKRIDNKDEERQQKREILLFWGKEKGYCCNQQNCKFRTTPNQPASNIKLPTVIMAWTCLNHKFRQTQPAPADVCVEVGIISPHHMHHVGPGPPWPCLAWPGPGPGPHVKRSSHAVPLRCGCYVLFRELVSYQLFYFQTHNIARIGPNEFYT